MKLPKEHEARAALLRSIASRYANGETTTELGEAHEVGSKTISRWLREAGVEVRSRGKPRGSHHRDTRHKVAPTIERYLKGEGIKSIAADLDISHETVRQWVLQAGHHMRARGKYARKGM